MTTCAQCHAMFLARKPGQYFCKASCRAAYQRETGLQGQVAGVTRLLRGVSVVIHFPDGPAAEKAIALTKRQTVSIVREPE
jgi:hypothetical protein